MKASTLVKIDYTNWRGERGERTITPFYVAFSTSEWHPEPQWVLYALDVGKGEPRVFAMKDIHSWVPLPLEEAR